jgi:hypothetical protein
VAYIGRAAGLPAVRRRAADFGRRVVLAQTLIDHLAQQIVVGPSEIFHLGDELGRYPMPSDAAWIMLNEVMPSGRRPHSSPSR